MTASAWLQSRTPLPTLFILTSNTRLSNRLKVLLTQRKTLKIDGSCQGAWDFAVEVLFRNGEIIDSFVVSSSLQPLANGSYYSTHSVILLYCI